MASELTVCLFLNFLFDVYEKLPIVVLQIYHKGRASGFDDPPSWSEGNYQPDESYWKARTNATWLAADEEEISQHPLPDTQIADTAVKMLKELAESNRPFFLAVGFYKPHLPFIFPSRFLDYYPEHAVTMPSNPHVPDEMPEVNASFS